MAGQSRTSSIDVDVDSALFQAALQEQLKRIGLRTEGAVLRLAIDVQNRARELAPVDTGRLRSSINHKPGRDGSGYYVDVGSNVEYAPHIEFGTSRAPAQPYLRPALAEAVADGLDVQGVA